MPNPTQHEQQVAKTVAATIRQLPGSAEEIVATMLAEQREQREAQVRGTLDRLGNYALANNNEELAALVDESKQELFDK
jgi:hypothetical protein